jgi:acyl-CoA thioesterase-1
MKKTITVLMAVLLVSGWVRAADLSKAPQINETQEHRDERMRQPFWRSKVMENEPVLFVQDEGRSVASGKLLFVPSAKPTVIAPDLVMIYEEGKDYLWKPGSDTIELTAGSRIPFKTAAQMVPPPGSPNTLQGVLFSEGRFFHDLQVQVTYPHAGLWPLPDAPQAQRLTRSYAKLKAKQPLKLVALGDSITEGYNASGFKQSEAPPYQPSYPQLVANTLQERFGAPVTLANLGRAGTGAGWGLERVAKVADEKPDLVILAFGMNHGEAAPAFEAVMRKLRDAVQTACPEADIVLVAPMTGNPRGFPAERFSGYRDALRNLTTPNVALADVTSPWLELLKCKSFSDLSGNNINHPNDFGHRLYAQVICQLFPLPAESRPSGVRKSK